MSENNTDSPFTQSLEEGMFLNGNMILQALSVARSLSSMPVTRRSVHRPKYTTKKVFSSSGRLIGKRKAAAKK